MYGYMIIRQILSSAHDVWNLSVQIPRRCARITGLSSDVATGLAARLQHLAASFAFWFLFPLTVWLTVGWIGLLLYWRWFLGTAERTDKDVDKANTKPAAVAFDEGDISCSIAEIQA